MNVQCHSCIGGTNLGEDIRKLDYGQHVVSGNLTIRCSYEHIILLKRFIKHTLLKFIGTPGRVFDMIRRRTLRTRGIKMLVRNPLFLFNSEYHLPSRYTRQ